MGRLFIVYLCLFTSWAHAAPISDNILSVYAVYEQETTHDNITLRFVGRKFAEKAYVHLADGRSYEGIGSRIPDIKDLFVFSVPVTDLTASTEYQFIIGNDENGYSPEFTIKTLTVGTDPIRFLQGGDMGYGEGVDQTPKTALKAEPDIILIGGDIAYANGETKTFNRWLIWFERMNEVMIRPNGRLIPMILAVGNHEVIGITRDGKIPRYHDEKAPFFFSFFTQAGDKSYFARRLGSHAVLLVLDTGHVYIHGSHQKRWLKKTLQRFQNIPNKIALYHAPLYPSNRSTLDPWSILGRNLWRPLFDKYGLTIGLENHDHTFKRTHMLRDNKVVKSGGTVYIGDGCWGRAPRSSKDRPYLLKHRGVTHVWTGEIRPQSIEMQATGFDDQIFDHFYIDQAQKIAFDIPFWLRGLPEFLVSLPADY